MRILAPFNQRGFILLEVFVGMVLFALGILALNRLHMATIQTNAAAESLTQATILAQKTVEDLSTRAYNDATLSVSPSPNHSYPGNPVYGKYNVSWNVSNSVPLTNTKTISVTVQWSEHSRQRTTSIAFIKGNI